MELGSLRVLENHHVIAHALHFLVHKAHEPSYPPVLMNYQIAGLKVVYAGHQPRDPGTPDGSVFGTATEYLKLGKDDKPAFSSWMHDNYDDLFTGLEQPNQLISRIQAKQAGLI